jgi:hypothetical protein
VARTRWLQDPLVHFVLFGVVVVSVDSALGVSADSQPTAVAAPERVIPVTPELVDDLQRNLAVTLERVPTDAEVDRAVEQWIDQEVLLREATTLGLADNDPIIRARLAEKMAFMLGAQQVPPEPDDAALRLLYETHKQDYTQQARMTLRQLYVANRSEQGRARAELLLHRAVAGEPLETLTAAADEPPGGPVLRGRTPESLAGLFGAPFTEGLDDAVVAGPTQSHHWVLRPSTTGWHVVQVVDRVTGGPLPFDAVRARLVARWRRAHVDAARSKAVAVLRAKTAVSGWPR